MLAEIATILLDLFCWSVFCRFYFSVCSPFILFAAFFQTERYRPAVAGMFGSLYWFWRRRGLTVFTGLPRRYFKFSRYR